MSDDTSTETAEPAKKKGKLLPILLLVLGLGGGFLVATKVGGGSKAADAPPPPPEAGEIAIIEPMNVNLAGGHYLRISLGVELTKKTPAKEFEKTGALAKVKDLVVTTYSGKTVEELSTEHGREEARKHVVEGAKERLEGEALNVYLTEFVMQ